MGRRSLPPRGLGIASQEFQLSWRLFLLLLVLGGLVEALLEVPFFVAAHLYGLLNRNNTSMEIVHSRWMNMGDCRLSHLQKSKAYDKVTILFTDKFLEEENHWECRVSEGVVCVKRMREKERRNIFHINSLGKINQQEAWMKCSN